ncbi:prepilin-type N-terminal cleavage/methylation domain-containing protein [bacterium]|nr:prepilin-type N-terminal cleavage/methylation domain-containing protein [bacterium]MCK4437107.1 prepilin-type N-terminal cleavage/methylation domain-containing protein [bacterium]
MERKGFTLIEVVMSMLILGIALIGILGAFVMGKANIVRARHRLEVACLLQQTMEYLQDVSYGSITNSNYPEEPVTIDDAGTTTTSDDLIGTRLARPPLPVSAIAGADGLYKSVTVKIKWTERSWGGGEQGVSEELITYFRKE